MRNKKAFTLVELISIIVLLSIIFLLVLPGIRSSIANRKQTHYENIVKTIESAAKMYYSIDSSSNKITVSTLVSKDYLSSGLTNPVDDTAINGCVLVGKDFDGYNAYTYYPDCNSLVQYTLTNLITNGSFESGSTYWTLNEGLSVSAGIVKYGNYSLKNYHAVQWAAAWKTNFATAASTNHIYYASMWLYSKTLGSGYCHSNFDIYYDSTDHFQGLGGIQTNLNIWEKKSNRVLIPVVSSPTIIMAAVGYTTTDTLQECYGDGVLLIDLTATFGAGNEPTQTWCDNNLDYFDGTTTIWK